MKPKLLVHPAHARCIDNETEANRLRQAGWLELPPPKSLGKNAVRQRKFRERCKGNGYRQVSAYLPAAVADDLLALRSDGETVSEMLCRLVPLWRAVN